MTAAGGSEVGDGSGSLEFLLLGPLEVRRNGTRVSWRCAADAITCLLEKKIVNDVRNSFASSLPVT